MNGDIFPKWLYREDSKQTSYQTVQTHIMLFLGRLVTR